MRHLKIHPDSDVTLVSANKAYSTPGKAIHEAIYFVKCQGLKSVDLVYDGFTMCIEPSSNLKELIAEFRYWKSLQSAKVKNSIK